LRLEREGRPMQTDRQERRTRATAYRGKLGCSPLTSSGAPRENARRARMPGGGGGYSINVVSVFSRRFVYKKAKKAKKVAGDVKKIPNARSAMYSQSIGTL